MSGVSFAAEQATGSFPLRFVRVTQAKLDYFGSYILALGVCYGAYDTFDAFLFRDGHSNWWNASFFLVGVVAGVVSRLAKERFGLDSRIIQSERDRGIAGLFLFSNSYYCKPWFASFSSGVIVGNYLTDRWKGDERDVG